jgi:hypothetical protein
MELTAVLLFVRASKIIQSPIYSRLSIVVVEAL